MATDINTRFCTAQNVFGNGTTVSSTDWLDQLVAQDFDGGGVGPDVEILVTTSFAGGTSAQFQLVAVDSAGANPVVVATTAAIPIAQLVAPVGATPMGGTRILLSMSPVTSLPASTLTHYRLQTVNVGNNSAGAISAGFVPRAATVAPNKGYPAGY